MAASPLEQCEVLYDWTAETEHDLSLHAGETIEILEKNDHGWWLGIVQRNGNVYRGYFPKNYVKEKVRLAPAPPPRPQDLRRGESDSVAETAAAVQKVSLSPSTASAPLPTSPTAASGSRVTSVRRAAFSLRSLQAFDDLTEKGFAVEISSSSSPAPSASSSTAANGPRPGPTDRVEVQIVGLIWDGASTDTREFGRGVIRFPLGQRLVPAGLEQAIVQHLSVGVSATVTCSPSSAYGAAGNPPAVPPNSFVIFHLTLLSAAPSASLSVEGPAEFFSSGVRDREREKSRRDSRIVLVPAGDRERGGAEDVTEG